MLFTSMTYAQTVTSTVNVSPYAYGLSIDGEWYNGGDFTTTIRNSWPMIRRRGSTTITNIIPTVNSNFWNNFGHGASGYVIGDRLVLESSGNIHTLNAIRATSVKSGNQWRIEQNEYMRKLWSGGPTSYAIPSIHMEAEIVITTNTPCQGMWTIGTTTTDFVAAPDVEPSLERSGFSEIGLTLYVNGNSTGLTVIGASPQAVTLDGTYTFNMGDCLVIE